MTRLSSTFSAWLSVAWNFIEHNARFIFLFLVVLTLLIAYEIRYLPLPLFMSRLLAPILVILVFLTIHVARLTRDATKDKRDASAKVGRLWLEFAFVVAFGLVIAAIQSDLQEETTVHSNYRNAISQLGSLSPAVRMSGIDYLNKTCMGKRKKPHPDKCNKDDTTKLLNNHVKFFTQSKSYQEDFAEAPSKDIVKIIEILRERQELSYIRWNGAYLRGVDLSGADLQGANLDEANLRDANLRGTNLQEANLRQTKLQGARLRQTKLQGADLYETKLQGADLYGAKLQGANLYRANLQGAHLRQAKLQGAYSKYEASSIDFCTRINSRIGKPTEIDMDIIPNEFKNTVNTGTLTKETATVIIKEYNENLTDEQARCELP